MTPAAPFYADLAEGPAGGGAVWLTAADGVRIRVGYFPGGVRGTVVLLPGRTEYVEKYGRTAAALGARGWSVLVVDWRGQGLADRLLPDPMLGHVGQFTDYQQDLDAALGWLDRSGPGFGLTGPRVMLAHSMGGLIGLRALHRGLGFRAAAFSAPMWGIRVPLWRKPMAAVLSRSLRPLPQDRRFAPTASPLNYMLAAPFAGNLLTGDADVWAYLGRQALADPRLGLGGPSVGWVRTALREVRTMMRQPPPVLPTLAAVGSGEHIVLPGPIRRHMAGWSGGRFMEFDGARHEILMETAAHRDRFLDAATALWDSAL